MSGFELDGPTFALGVGVVFALALGAIALRPEQIVRTPRIVLALLALVSALAVVQLVQINPLGLRLTMDPSTEPLLPAGDPMQEVYRDAVRDFGDDEVYVIAVECGDVFTTSCLTSMDEIVSPIAQLDGVRSVSSILDVTSFRYVVEEDWIEVRPFIEDIPDDPAELADLRKRALADPVYRRTIVSEGGDAAAINISFRAMTDAELIASDLDGQISRLLAEHASPELRFHVSGRPHFKTHVYHGMTRDLRTLIPLSVIVAALVLWLFNGSARGVLIPIATALTANLWTFAGMATVGRPLTLLTGLLAPMLLAIGTIYAVHVLSRYDEEAEAGPDVERVVERTLRHLVVPVMIAGLTTVIGFAALLITDVPAVFELGLLSMLGVASITLLSLAGIPAVLALLPLRAVGDRESGIAHVLTQRLDAALVGLSRGVARHARAITHGAVAVAIASLIALPFIVIDTDYLSYFDPDDPVRVDFEAVNRLLAGAIPLYVVLDGGESGSFREPALLRAVEALQRKLDAVEGVSRTLSFLDTLRVLNRAFNSDDPAAERIPDTRPGVTELLFMIPKSELAHFTTVNHARANLIVRTGEVGSAVIDRLTADIEAVIRATPLPGGIQARVTGNAILLARSADGIARGQPMSVATAAIAIFALITIGLRSPRLGAVAMIPNLLPVLVFFGVLGLGAAPLSLPTSLIGCVALGIAIDDTVHFLVRYRHERSSGCTPEEAALVAGRQIGRPIAITSVMLSLGFLVVAFSEFATLQEFGVLSALTMVICLVTDLILLPAVLVRAQV